MAFLPAPGHVQHSAIVLIFLRRCASYFSMLIAGSQGLERLMILLHPGKHRTHQTSTLCRWLLGNRSQRAQKDITRAMPGGNNLFINSPQKMTIAFR